ncbi:MAG: alkaline phosphatase [bacterium]|nr:alkaline phosphatase [bacterium]
MTFGLCADVHQDIMHDAVERMNAFVHAMNERKVDFVAQLGDFCTPKEENRRFLETFHSVDGSHHHVRGNHDTDGGFDAEQVKAFWGIEATTYTFERGGVQFLVLDGNDRHENADAGYPRHVGPEQLAWLDAELTAGAGPVVVLSHQSLENPSGVDNAGAVRAVLERANERAGWRRVLACFSGHHHLDAVVEIAGIPYVQVNSMSYYWVGREYKHQSYPQHIHASHPWIEFTMPYRDPLWATVTIDPEADEIRIEGVRSSWVAPTPADLGYPAEAMKMGIACSVADRTLAIEQPRD